MHNVPNFFYIQTDDQNKINHCDYIILHVDLTKNIHE